MRSRFVQPLERVLPISNGDTLTVRARLSAGDELDMFARTTDINEAGKARMKSDQVQLGLIAAYLLDWSFVDDDGRKVVIRGEPLAVLEAAVRQLDGPDFQEVHQAISAHHAQIEAERAREKKTLAGDNALKATSESPSDAAGALIGSVT